MGPLPGATRAGTRRRAVFYFLSAGYSPRFLFAEKPPRLHSGISRNSLAIDR